MLFEQTFMAFIFILLSQNNILLDFRYFTGLKTGLSSVWNFGSNCLFSESFSNF